MAAGGGGSSGAGKETAGATTLSDLNNFQFQEGKRELEKYRRCDLAEGRKEAPKGSRVCGRASLDTAKKAGEPEPGGAVGEALRGERSPPQGCSPGERWARSVWECGGRRASGRDALAPYSLVRPRAPCPRGLQAPASPRLLPRRRRAAAASQQLALSAFARLADRWKVPGCGLLPSFPEPLLSCFSPFLSIKVAAVRRRAGGPQQAQRPRAVSSAAGYLPGGGRTQRFVRSGPTFWKFSCAAASFHTEPSLRLQKIHPPFRQFSP